MTNRLAEHLTTWKWWYAIIAMIAFIVGSQTPLVATLLGAADEQTLSLMTPVTFLAFTLLALAAVALLARAWPSAQDLGLRTGLSRRDWLIIATLFVVTHVFFWLVGVVEGQSTTEQATTAFDEMGLTGSLAPAIAVVISSVILAPICEEIFYRGLILRPVHDHLARSGASRWLAAGIAIAVATVAFALPHLGDGVTPGIVLAYLLTGVGLGLVYVLTGSMTAVMVAHALQSWFAFSQVLIFGRGDNAVSPILWIIVLGCPLWVYLISIGLARVFPDRPTRGGVAR